MLLGTDWLGAAIGVFGTVSIISGATLTVRSTIPKETIAQQKELILTLKTTNDEFNRQIQDLQTKHIEAVHALATIQGQVDILKSIPLEKISNDLGSMTNMISGMLTTQRDIIKLVKSEKKAIRAANK